MKKIKFGVIGTNFISDSFCEAVAMVECAEVTAVYSRAKETGEKFAERNGIERVYVDYDEMISSDIDAVYVASPTFMHCEHTLRALSMDKHVLCEKMMSAHIDSARRMVDLAKERGLVLLEAMRPDFDPFFDVLKKAIGKIGRIRRANLEYCQYSSRYDKFKNGIVLNAFDPKIANSALADIGIYPLHICVRLFGRPQTLSASSLLLDNGFEGYGHLTLGYGDIIATVNYSKITEGVADSVIEGEMGSVTFDKPNAPTKVMLHLRGGEPEALIYEPIKNNMTYEITSFCNMILGNESADEYLDATLNSIEIVSEAYRLTGADKFMDEKIIPRST